MALAPLTPKVEFMLEHRLRRVAALVRAITFHRTGAVLWSAVALIAAALAVTQQRSVGFAPYAAPILLGVFVLATVVAVWRVYRDRSDLSTATRYLAAQYPELRSALNAAVEQRPEADGQFHFLQRRVINDALHHAEARDWLRQPRRHARWLLVGHGLALVAALGLSARVIQAHRPAPRGAAALFSSGLEITPGDAELERGSTVVIAARFGDRTLPSEAVLVWRSMGAEEQRAPMARSLSDPVFAFTLTPLTADVAYHIQYDGKKTSTFALKVFDRPALVRADATLDYPDYTGLQDRQIVDTRRVSAVAGTQLNYEFIMNKPLSAATLVGAEQRQIALTVNPTDRSRFNLSTTITQSDRFSLQLVDEAGRTNGSPIDVRIEAVENRRPELKLTFPRGDQRVSPLQEMQLQAEARDDFGLHNYGLGLSVAEGEPNYLSLAPTNATPPVQANIDHLLALETFKVKPDQLVTWFAWADDIGPDGKVRRTTSDVFFAEVRRLEEIFREDANGGGGNNQPGAGGGGPGEELLETQRQISIATWKLRQQDASTANFGKDAVTLRDSQAEAQQQLAEAMKRLEEPRMRAAAGQAANLMKQAEKGLGEAAEKKNTDPLKEAWAGARGAYEALLRMQPRDANVSQSRNGGQGSGSRGREQLNELDFRNEEDRYQTETQAQPPPTPEQRDQLNVLARLRELARRQQDINQRLQELQTALAAAEDEAQREAIRRELKRLEDEQRRMLSEVDEARQRVDRLQPGEQTKQAREQLERTREDMRRASEQLAQGEVSQALAAGSRARDNLQQTSEDLRKDAANRFGDQMREARRQARELTEAQKQASRELDEMNRGQQSLDDSAKREELAQQLQQQAGRRDGLLDTLRQVTEESDGTEPRLHRQLYDLLRQQQQSNATQELNASAELLRRGFVEPAKERQAAVTREIEQLQRAVERAAGSVLGDETNELRFAQRELEDLTRELQRDRESGEARAGAAGEPGAAPGESGEKADAGAAGSAKEQEQSERLARAEKGEPGQSHSAGEGKEGGESGGGESPATARNAGDPSAASAPNPNGGGGGNGRGQPGATDAESLAQLAREMSEATGGGEGARGPLTGGGFGEWAERLRTVEELLEQPELRQRLAGARFQAEEIRRANQREGKAPQWDLVEMGVVAPLQDARAWLRQELNRREQPDALHPIDRDPVPERYAESVRKYYEALGRGDAAEAKP